MRSPEEILALLDERRLSRSPLLRKMEEVRRAYNGELVIPLPELDSANVPAVGNLVVQGVDALGQRTASVMPDVRYVPVRDSKPAQQAARKKRLANLGWWEANEMPAKLGRRARWYHGLACTGVYVCPDDKLGGPRWFLRQPLTTFPGETANPEDVTPEDVIFCYQRTLRWIKDKYPHAFLRLRKGDDPKMSDKFEVVEYHDAECTVLLVVGKKDLASQPTGDAWVVLEEAYHGLDLCPAVVLGRPSLDKPMGQFDQMVGMYQLQARMMALEVVAVERGIFPDTWLVANGTMNPQIIREADGIRGQTGIVKDGNITVVNPQPTYLATQMRSDLERSQRMTARIPAEFGGESTSNVRTGRRGDAILSAAIDFTIQEAQRDFERSLEAENKIAAAIEKKFFKQRKSVYVAFQGTHARVDYSPADLWDSDRHTVRYSLAGADINNQTIVGGQKVGMGTMSKQTFMEQDPQIEDAEQEHDRVIAEGIEQAVLSAFQQQAASGAIPPGDAARVMELVRSDKMELAEAILQVQREAQERQAEMVPEGAPEAQPGLALPGMGAEQPTIGEPAEGMANLSQLLGALRRPQMQLPVERSAA